MANLDLKPWQPPPCWIRHPYAPNPDNATHNSGRPQAARLARQLLEAGLSKFEPDPGEALLRAKGPRTPATAHAPE
jgi:hypothetical protein